MASVIPKSLNAPTPPISQSFKADVQSVLPIPPGPV